MCYKSTDLRKGRHSNSSLTFGTIKILTLPSEDSWPASTGLLWLYYLSFQDLLTTLWSITSKIVQPTDKRSIIINYYHFWFVPVLAVFSNYGLYLLRQALLLRRVISTARTEVLLREKHWARRRRSKRVRVRERLRLRGESESQRETESEREWECSLCILKLYVLLRNFLSGLISDRWTQMKPSLLDSVSRLVNRVQRTWFLGI